MMPFGLDLKSLVIGMLFAWFAVPWIMGLINRPAQSKTP
jgi:hypothetical protein